MHLISKDSFVRWGELCLWEEDDTIKISAILELNTRRALFVRLNEPESRVWRCCDGSMTVEDIVNQITRFNEMDFSIRQDNVIDFIKGLCDIGLLTLSKKNVKILRKYWRDDEKIKRNVYVDSNEDEDGVTILNNRTNFLAQLDRDWLPLWRLCGGNFMISQIVSELITNSKDMLPIDIRLRLRYLEGIGAVSVS